jgi:hypothetical protein
VTGVLQRAGEEIGDPLVILDDQYSDGGPPRNAVESITRLATGDF